MGGSRRRRRRVFVHKYHPTRGIIQRLKAANDIDVVCASPSKDSLWTRYIPLWSRPARYRVHADEQLRRFRERRAGRLVVGDGLDLSAGVYAIIEQRIAPRVAASIRTLECVLRYLKKNPIDLEVLIANVGDVVSLLDCACRAKGVPSYLIINGWMGGDFLDEGKYATCINAYATSIRDHYFKDMQNIVCLGDPRMDAYAPVGKRRHEPLEPVTVTVGSAGHNNTDLNSYVAVEFEFMHDVLKALRIARLRGFRMRVVIKVRANGYIEQYKAFADEYFPGLVDEFLDATPMREVLERTDFYITFYSQSLLEAACLGIPCVYYKNDDEILDPPFDGRSELVMVTGVDALVQAIEDYHAGHERYDHFMEREVLEKYIGHLDGGNLDRNVRQIYEMLRQGGER